MFTRLLSYFTTSKNVNVNEINYNDYENILEYIPNNKLKINNKKSKANSPLIKGDVVYIYYKFRLVSSFLTEFWLLLNIRYGIEYRLSSIL